MNATVTSTISCPKCGTTFETSARTNTRCRSCRYVCNIPRSGSGTHPVPARQQPARDSAPLDLALLQLACGHLYGFRGSEAQAQHAVAIGQSINCGRCGPEDDTELMPRDAVGIVTTMPGAEFEALILDTKRFLQFWSDCERSVAS